VPVSIGTLSFPIRPVNAWVKVGQHSGEPQVASVLNTYGRIAAAANINPCCLHLAPSLHYNIGTYCTLITMIIVKITSLVGAGLEFAHVGACEPICKTCAVRQLA